MQILIHYWPGWELSLFLSKIIEILGERSSMDDTEQTDSESSSLHQFGILNATMDWGPNQTKGHTLSKKLTFLIRIRTCACAYQGLRNVNFSKEFACLLNKWPVPLQRSLFSKMICGKQERLFQVVFLNKYKRLRYS